jgi:hypothetical protein
VARRQSWGWRGGWDVDERTEEGREGRKEREERTCNVAQIYQQIRMYNSLEAESHEKIWGSRL